jgi:YD repeat-containing protein
VNRQTDRYDPLNGHSTTHYDRANNIEFTTDALGRETHYEYDALNRRTKIVEADPDGIAGALTSPETEYAYDAVGNTVSVTDPLGGITKYVYDDLNRQVFIISPDPDGAAGPEISPITGYTYDAFGNVRTATRYSDSAVVNIVSGHIVGVSDPAAETTAFVYDGLNRRVKVTEPGPQPSPVITYAYDLVGNLVSALDPLNSETKYEYDALNRLTFTIYPDPDGASGPETSPITANTYDAVGNLTAMTRYSYSALINRNAQGHITSISDPAAQVTTYEYDALNRVTFVVAPDPDGVSGPETNPNTG